MKTYFRILSLFSLFALVIACSNDSDSKDNELETAIVISNLDFTITPNNENPLQIAVTPSAKNATSFTIYFDFIGNPSVFQTTSGSAVLNTYAEETATYQIKVVASAPNAKVVELIKEHTITAVQATVIADFESQSSTFIIDGGGDENKIKASVVSSPGGDNTSNVLLVKNVGEAYEAVTIVNNKYVDFSTPKKTVKLDFYQPTAASPDILVKLEGNSTEGGFDVEVLKTASATAGWQTIEFDFNNAKNSYPNHEEATVTLSQYQKFVVFIGFAQTDYAGEYYIDNIVGADFGNDQLDTDGDSVIDPIDDCVSTAGTAENNGCPAGPSVGASVPSKLEADILNIYSDQYTNQNVTTYQTSWSSNCTVENIEISTGDSVLKTSVLAENGYAGIEFSKTYDISNFKTVHFDVWTANMDDFRFKFEGSGGVEATISVTQKNEWVSIDIPLTSFVTTKEGALTDINLAVVSAASAGQIYLDNIYLHNDEVATDSSAALILTVTAPEGTTAMRLSGPWWDWNPAGGPVGVSDGANTFTFTFDPAPTEDMQYLYTIDAVSYENLIDNAANGDCTSKIDSGALITDYSSYANRVWKLGSSKTVINTFDSCN